MKMAFEDLNCINVRCTSFWERWGRGEAVHGLQQPGTKLAGGC